MLVTPYPAGSLGLCVCFAKDHFGPKEHLLQTLPSPQDFTKSMLNSCPNHLFPILVSRAHDPSGLREESRALEATISGMHHRCRLRETGWAELFGFSFVISKWLLPALVSDRWSRGTKSLGTRLSLS